MSAKHTPGPWTIRYRTNVFGIRRDVGHVGSVAVCGGHDSNQVDCGPESEANARLIAAAPDLLEALRDMWEWQASVQELVPEGLAFLVMGAIRKATGES